MRNLTTAICVIAVLALPVSAGAQGTTAFDGTYEGVSRQIEATSMMNYKRMNCTPDGKPGPLTIANGAARAGAADNPMEGSVNGQGADPPPEYENGGPPTNAAASTPGRPLMRSISRSLNTFARARS